ncbi:hypothetical protein N779_02615 [Vibrio coralliilyticus OCN008]|nr:hypothetical protein N779_02615 [Vibrio coralliilyticus OCN008]
MADKNAPPEMGEKIGKITTRRLKITNFMKGFEVILVEKSARI